MNQDLKDIAETFQGADREMRLQLLLDFAKKLPALPEELAAERDADEHRVPECETPVYLWVLPADGHVRIHAEVAEESPTVQGFLGIIHRAYDNKPAEEVAQVPSDLIEQVGLGEVVRMQRRVGIAAIVGRIRDQAARLATADANHN